MPDFNPITGADHIRQAARRIRQQVELASAQLEELIMQVPTSEVRNMLSESNICLHESRQTLNATLERIGD